MIPTTSGLIDTHSHLLPGVDDGCKTVDESIAYARLLVEAGYTHAFCTPHVWANLAENHVGSIPDMVRRLQTELHRAGISLSLHGGGEINLRKDLMQGLPQYLVTYGMKRQYALVDLWADRLPAHFEPTIRWMQDFGIIVILAHPERLRAAQDQPELADYFAELGLLLQGNLQCFQDPLGSPTRRTADRYLSEDRYWMLGSDTHGPAGLPQRLAGLRRVRELVSAETLARLTHQNPAKLL